MSLSKPRLLFALAVVAFLVINVVGTHKSFTEPYPGLNDFMSRWEGARSYWIDGLDPYGDQASLNIQMRIYGRPVREGEDPGYFAYPFYTVFLVAPLVLLPYAWASAIWMVLLEVCLIVALLLLLDIFGWRPKPWLLALLMVWALLAYYPSRGLILGQPGLVVYLFEVLALWALVKDHDTLAGVVLALSTLKPQMGFLFVPFLLVWGLYKRRWRFMAAFVVLMGVFMLASFVLLPGWLGEWLWQVSDYTSYTALGSPVWIVMQYYLHLGVVGEWIVNLIFYALMLWAWYRLMVRHHEDRFLWTAAITLTVTHLVATRTATPHYVVFMLPLIFCLHWIDRHNKRRGSLWIVLVLAALFFIPWIHALLTVQAKFEHPTVYLPVPFGTVLLLWFTRRWWWNGSSPEPKNV
jgi:hypothetical protein